MNFKLVSDSSSKVYTLSGSYNAAQQAASDFMEENANDFKAAVPAKYPNANFVIEHTTGLCSFYAEAGGLIIGFEGAHNAENDNGKYYN